MRTIAIETFKIINKETPQYPHDLVTLKNNKYNFRYSNTAHIPTVKTTRYGLNSFRYYASFNTLSCLEAFLQIFVM
jgi:hypothetical protein